MVDIENDIETLVESTCHFSVGKHQLMNGRCETNPLDQATNVCGTCYGDFCDGCLVTMKARKHPTCKECALIVSGVRAGAKPEIRGSRRTAKERRETYKSLPSEEKVFEYFDSSARSKASGDSLMPLGAQEEQSLAAPGSNAQPTDEPGQGNESDESEDQAKPPSSKKRSIGKRKKKSVEPVIDTSSELARLDDLSSNLATSADSESANDGAKSKARSKPRGKKRNGRSRSAINKLEEIQSAAPTPQPKQGRLVPPRKTRADDSADTALVPSPNPEEPMDQAQLDPIDVPSADEKHPPVERPISRPRKPRKTWPKTVNQSPPEVSKAPSERPRWPRAEVNKPPTDSKAKAAIEAPISGPAIFDKLTKANSASSAESTTDPATPPTPAVMADNDTSADQVPPSKAQQPDLGTDESVKLAGAESTEIELPTTEVAEIEVAETEAPAELQPPSLSEDPFASTRNVQTDDFLSASQPPPPSATQARGSAENMPIVGSAPTADDSPTSEFKTWSLDDASFSASNANTGDGEDNDATNTESGTSSAASTTWDPDATPWDTSSESWDESIDSEDVPATDTEVAPSMSAVDALMHGPEPTRASTTSLLEASADLTNEISSVDSSELDAAGNWVPPALRATESHRREDD